MILDISVWANYQRKNKKNIGRNIRLKINSQPNNYLGRISVLVLVGGISKEIALEDVFELILVDPNFLWFSTY